MSGYASFYRVNLLLLITDEQTCTCVFCFHDDLKLSANGKLEKLPSRSDRPH